MASEDKMKEIENRLIRDQLVNLKKRGTPDSDPRVKALYRVLAQQRVAAPREGTDFPMQIKFKPRRRQNG